MIARLIISTLLEKRVEKINKILAEGGYTTNHPDLLYFSDDSKLGIAEARKIKEHFSLKPYSSKGRAVVLEDASALTHEAQNALLKTLEEPPKDAILLLAAPSDAKLLPTILSRCQIVRVQGLGDRVQKENYIEDIEKLLKASIEDRFEYIEKLKDREEFLYAMVSYFHHSLTDSTHERRHLAKLNQFLRELLQAEEWQKQNVNIRGILEHLMLVMPKLESRV